MNFISEKEDMASELRLRIYTSIFLSYIFYMSYISNVFFLFIVYISYLLCLYEILLLSKYKFLSFILVTTCIYIILQNNIDYISIILQTICIDTSCFIIGKYFGRTKFTSISPNKTIEGLYGGMIAYITLSFFVQTHIIIFFSAIFGDLLFSFIKRQNHIKDFSQIIPGHGGILDRLDSIIMTISCYYFYNMLT